jgi:hypothetical protein
MSYAVFIEDLSYFCAEENVDVVLSSTRCDPDFVLELCDIKSIP